MNVTKDTKKDFLRFNKKSGELQGVEFDMTKAAIKLN